MLTSLRRESARSALLAEPHLLVGVVAGLASAVTWNALPLVLFGLGSTAWLFHAVTSDARMKRIGRARRDADERAREDARMERLRALQAELVTPPYKERVLRGALPDVARGYRHLARIAQELERRLGSQPELELEWRVRLEGEIGQVEELYLTLARWRMEGKGNAERLDLRMSVLLGELALLLEQTEQGELDLIHFRLRLDELSAEVVAESTALNEDAALAPC